MSIKNLFERKPKDLGELSGENQKEQTPGQTKAERIAGLKARKERLQEEIKRYKNKGFSRKEAKIAAEKRFKEKEKDPEKMEGVEMWEEKIKEKNSSAIETATENFVFAIKPIFEGKSGREMEKGIYFKVGDRKFMINAAGEFPKDIFDAMLWELDEEGESKIHTEARIDDSEKAKDKNDPRISIKARQAGNPDFYKCNFTKRHLDVSKIGKGDQKLSEFPESENAISGLAYGLETMEYVKKGEIEFE